MKYKRQILLVVLFILVCKSIFSQEYNYKHYTVEDGLPSSEVYSTFQDSKGYIWFATDGGVSRFDGYEFQNFDIKDGLTDNTVFLITEDNFGRIWFGTFNKKLCYFYNDSIYEYKYNDKILINSNQNAILKSFLIDQNNIIWLGFGLYGIIKIDENGTLTSINDEIDNKLVVYNDKNQVVWAMTRSTKRLEFIKKRIKHDFEVNLKIMNPIHKPVEGKMKLMSDNLLVSNLEVIKYKNQYLFFNLDSLYLLNIESDKIEHITIKTNPIVNSSRLYSSFFYDNLIWLCMENQGVIVATIVDDKLVEKAHLLHDQLVSRVYKDNAGSFWFTTLNNGVFYLKSDNYFNNSTKATSIEVDTIGANLFIGLKNKGILKKRIDGVVDNEELIYSYHDVEPRMIYNYFTNSIVISGEKDKLVTINNTGKTSTINGLVNSYVKSFMIDSNTLYWVNGFGVSKVQNNKLVFSSELAGYKKIWCTSLVKQNRFIWLGTNVGLFKLNDDTYELLEPFSNQKLLESAITSLAKLNNETILIGTKSYGVVLMQNEKIIRVLDEQNGLPSNLIKCIHIDNQKEIWIGTNKGLARIKEYNLKQNEVQIITTKQGLISNEISDIKSYKNTIYIVTPKGLEEFDKTKVEINKTSSPLYITDFIVNSKSIKFKNNSEIELTHIENTIDIKYVSLNYKSTSNIKYSYRLNGIDTNWQTTTLREIKFYGLPDGEYQFEVKAKNEDEIWSKPIILKFRIHPPFWITWWFILIEILICLVVIIILFKYREKQLLLKNEKDRTISESEKKIVELELKALRSQMNPHFIFNTLNSIQLYISNNNFKDSNRYITNFSRLIRMVLNHSEKQYITLREEIEMLNLYVELEKIRFNNQFEYQIKIDDELDLDCDKIPPMLLQPFIENAIWHGLMKKTEKGLIQVDLLVQNDLLICTVCDNGIGREAAKKIKEERKIQNKSVGMSITKERLNLMSNEHYKDMNVELIDLFDNNNMPCGTKVIVKIPLK